MRRGLTLLELLIVLALLAALGAIAVPAVSGALAERSFDAAADQILDHLRFARNHARSTNRTVVVLYRGGSSHLEVREFGADPDALGTLGESAGMNEMATADDLLADGPTGVDAEEHGTLVLASYARFALPGDVRLQRARPEFLDERDDLLDDAPDFGAPEFDEVDFDDPFTDPRDAAMNVRLAVFLPDGQAILTTSMWLVDGDERAGEITIDPFTGAVRFERAAVVLRNALDDAEADAERDDADTEDDRTFDAEPGDDRSPTAQPEASAATSGTNGSGGADDANSDSDSGTGTDTDTDRDADEDES